MSAPTARGSAIAVLVLLAVVGSAVLPQRSATAALSGLTDDGPDGNTTGPNDWDALPTAVISSSTTTDPCGNGILDPDQLDGKLDDLDLDNPQPTPGNVVAKGDFCQVWRAVEMVPDGSGGFDVVLYGAWRRFSGNGEVSGFWPLVGPNPGKDDDYLIQFGPDSGGGGEPVQVLAWNGSAWQSAGVLPPSIFEVAFEPPANPLFGEFALNLTAAGLWPDSGADQCAVYASDFVFSRTGNSANAELQDYVGLPPQDITPCGELVVAKETTPTVPIPAAGFGYLVERAGSGDVTPGQGSVGGTLTVPDSPSAMITPVLGGTDFEISEPTIPAPWALDSIECSAIDPDTGERTTYPADGQEFPVTPGTTTTCTITNTGPDATVTVVKAANPSDGTDFDFTASGQPGFTLADGESNTFPVTAGDAVVIQETPPAGWVLTSIACTGDDGAIIDVGAGTATLDPDLGEQIVCVFGNGLDTPPATATLAVVKSAPANDGTDFPFSVTGPGVSPTSFDLTPPDSRLQMLAGLTPDSQGSDYVITETVPAGWELTGLSCASSEDNTPIDISGATATVTLVPGERAVCVFADAPLPPEPARLTVVKATDPAGGTGFNFRTPGLTPSTFTLDDGGSRSFEDLAAGDYTVVEQVPDDWQVSGSCTDGSQVVNDAVTVSLAPGDDVTCTFTNTARAALTVTKRADPQSGQPFTFGLAYARMAPSTFILDDDGSGTSDPDSAQYPSSITGPALPPGLYTISEQPASGWTLADLTCTGDGVEFIDVASATAVVRLPPGGSASCTYRNTQDGTPTPTPTATPTTGPSPGPGDPTAPPGDLGPSTGAPEWLVRALGLGALLLGIGIALWVMSALNRRGSQE